MKKTRVDERALDDEIAALMKDKKYVTRIPRKPLPAGWVLVHNHVVPQKTLGLNGFRAWIQPLDETLQVCSCDWAGVDLRGLVHYRVASRFTAR